MIFIKFRVIKSDQVISIKAYRNSYFIFTYINTRFSYAITNTELIRNNTYLNEQ